MLEEIKYQSNGMLILAKKIIKHVTDIGLVNVLELSNIGKSTGKVKQFKDLVEGLSKNKITAI